MAEQSHNNRGEALAKAQGLRDDLAKPEGVFLFRYEPNSLLQALDQPIAAGARGGASPVVYRFDLRDGKTYSLAQEFPVSGDPAAVDLAELEERFLFVEAVDSARCVEEGVLTDMREADLGSILGFGFAPFTGGTISYIDGMGTKAFVALCRDFAKRHGARFAPCKLLVDMAKKGDTFYGRFPPQAPKAAA